MSSLASVTGVVGRCIVKWTVKPGDPRENVTSVHSWYTRCSPRPPLRGAGQRKHADERVVRSRAMVLDRDDDSPGWCPGPHDDGWSAH